MATTPRIQLAVSAIVERGGHFLLVRRSSPPDAQNWAFPGGRVEPGETTRQAVLRELKEETGLDGEVDRVFDVYDFVTTDKNEHAAPHHFTLIVFHVSVHDVSMANADTDAEELSWINPSDADTLPMPPSMREALKRLASAS